MPMQMMRVRVMRVFMCQSCVTVRVRMPGYYSCVIRLITHMRMLVMRVMRMPMRVLRRVVTVRMVMVLSNM
jgi:hypothetical protein